MQENTKNNRLSNLVDSPEDQEKMKKEITEINLPDVNDIPGQEDFVPAPLGEMADTTTASADEEGEDVFNDNIDEDIIDSADSNVSTEEKETLADTFSDMPGDDEKLREAALGNTDDDGVPLNEGSFRDNVTATDLDVPGAELDDANEKIGEEDEENNDYSLGIGHLGADNDIIPEDRF